MAAGVTYSGVPLSSVINELNDFEATMQSYVERLVLVARSVIMERLEVHLGTTSEHLTVSFRPNSFLGYTIMVGPKDEIGVFVFEGVKPHTIQSSTPMPIGNGNFVTVVHHPGYESKRDAIERAVFEGIVAAMEALG